LFVPERDKVGNVIQLWWGNTCWTAYTWKIKEIMDVKGCELIGLIHLKYSVSMEQFGICVLNFISHMSSSSHPKL